MDLRERRELNKGFGDGLSRAFELVLTPMILALAGLWLDRRFGLTPVLTLVFAFWGIAVTTYMAWVRYDQDMQAEEQRHSSTPRRRTSRRWETAPGADVAVGEAAPADV